MAIAGITWFPTIGRDARVEDVENVQSVGRVLFLRRWRGAASFEGVPNFSRISAFGGGS